MTPQELINLPGYMGRKRLPHSPYDDIIDRFCEINGITLNHQKYTDMIDAIAEILEEDE